MVQTGPDRARVTASHTYSSTFYGVPSIEQVEEELAKAKRAVGEGARVRFKSHDGDQRDGYSVSLTVSK